jgi:hypothetical protein
MVRDVIRVVMARLPYAMIRIGTIANRLGIPRPDTDQLADEAVAEGLLMRQLDCCLLSEREAKRLGLRLASTPYRGKHNPSEWYWIRDRPPVYATEAERVRYEDKLAKWLDNPWLTPPGLLPGSYRNRIWWLMRIKREYAKSRHPKGRRHIYIGEMEDDPRGQEDDRLAERLADVARWVSSVEADDDPRRQSPADRGRAHVPLEEHQRAERLAELARWAEDRSAGRLPPRRDDRQKSARAGKAEYHQAMRPDIVIGSTTPGWTPAHEMIRMATDSAGSPIHIPLKGTCLVCGGGELGPDAGCLGCCRSSLDQSDVWRWLDAERTPDVA